MEDTLLIDAVERFVRGEMSPEETIYFKDLRKNNPELDQAVVEQTFFLNELDKYCDTKNFKHSLNEVEANLIEEGFISKEAPKGKAKVIQLWHKYKRTIAVAASIAGVVSIFIAGITSAVTTNKESNIKPLVEILKKQEIKTSQIEHKLENLARANNVTAVKPKINIDSKFRATGFLIDVNNNYIVTNAHVIDEAKHKLIIENNKGDQFSATTVYVNNISDIAIIKVDDKDFKKLPALPFSIRKRNADLGEQVFMLGFPKQEIVYGEGYVSAKNGYQMDTIYCQLSTTANEGNSGSPVITKNGELIGIITSTETNADGVVFAIKSSNIYRALDEVKKMDNYKDIKISSSPSMRGLDRETQIKKVEDYVFMIKGN
jgi:S1-C subfamily serine protease